MKQIRIARWFDTFVNLKPCASQGGEFLAIEFVIPGRSWQFAGEGGQIFLRRRHEISDVGEERARCVQVGWVLGVGKAEGTNRFYKPVQRRSIVANTIAGIHPKSHVTCTDLSIVVIKSPILQRVKELNRLRDICAALIPLG